MKKRVFKLYQSNNIMALSFAILLISALFMLEGLWITISPQRAKKITLQLLKHPTTLRTLGICELAIGIALTVHVLSTL